MLSNDTLSAVESVKKELDSLIGDIEEAEWLCADDSVLIEFKERSRELQWMLDGKEFDNVKAVAPDLFAELLAEDAQWMLDSLSERIAAMGEMSRRIETLRNNAVDLGNMK